MSSYKKWKRIAAAELKKVPECFPYYKGDEDPTNVEKINIIYPKREWLLESPVADLAQRRDYQHFSAVDTTSGVRLDVAFERLTGGFARVWARVKVDGRHLLLPERVHRDFSDGSRYTYSAGGVQLECGAPLRYWRVGVNASMVLCDDQAATTVASAANVVHVRLGVRTAALSHPFGIPTRCPASMLARRLVADKRVITDDDARQALRSWCGLSSGASGDSDDVIPDAFSQATTFYAELVVDGERSERLLHGWRLRRLGRSSLLDGSRHLVGCAGENGTAFHIIESTGGRCYGFGYHLNYFDQTVKKGLIEKTSDEPGAAFKVQYSTDWYGTVFRHQLNLTLGAVRQLDTYGAIRTDGAAVQDVEGTLKRSDLAEPCKALATTFILHESCASAVESQSGLFAFPMWKPEPVGPGGALLTVVDTSEPACQDPSLVGGKASSLAMLARASAFIRDNYTARNIQDIQFVVPKAVVLTVNAFEAFARLPAAARAIEDLKTAIHDVPDLWADNIGAAHPASESCVDKLSKLEMPPDLKQQLASKLVSVFGNHWSTSSSTQPASSTLRDGVRDTPSPPPLRFSVRSSAVGEDREDMSAAGQMCTLLNVPADIHSLAVSIVSCWASQFSPRAVSYKRHNGRALVDKIAVVVQEMAGSSCGGVRCAGVLFTCDPVSGRPDRAVLNANYGLGESVVSGNVEVDSFTFSWCCDQTNSLRLPTLTLVDKKCGSKNRKCVEKKCGDGTEEVLTGRESMAFCLSDEEAKRIARIGVQIAVLVGSPRDLEWALIDGASEVVFLQSRAVTSFLQESNFEVQHDLNSALLSNKEILCRANIEEVMPGVYSPLTVSIVQHNMLENAWRAMLIVQLPNCVNRSPYVNLFSVVIGKKAFADLSVFQVWGKFQKKFYEVNMIGYDIDQHENFTGGTAHEVKVSLINRAKNLLYLLRAGRDLETITKDAQRFAEDLRISLPEQADSLELLLSIGRQLHCVTDVVMAPVQVTLISSIYTMLVYSALESGQDDKKATPNMLALMARLLRSGYEVESARIPRELKDLQRALREEPEWTGLARASVKEAMSWLARDEGPAASEFRRFFDRNAHRCYKELDLHSRPWGDDCTALVAALQAEVLEDRRSGLATVVAGDDGESRQLMSASEIGDDGQCRPSVFRRQFLKFLLPRARHAAYCREAAKSALVKCIHQVRVAFRRLGDQLYREGKLPNPELVFFFTIDEIYRLITEGSSNLLPRAIRRFKMHENLNRQSFPLLQCGFPQPLMESPLNGNLSGAISVSGTAVCEGRAEGPARVVVDFKNEAHLIRKGEILIARVTDTGWTPYFPLLAGIVTEVGGLISHGAVVAREYGLPAIAGVVGATKIFRTGEEVVVDGHKGLVFKAQQQQHRQQSLKPQCQQQHRDE